MRNILAIALVLGVVSPSYATDWGDMNVKQRLAWTADYIRQTCPKGLTTHEYGRKNEIAGAPQWGVKIYINFHCRS